jgi:GTP 3',8-cyclase
MDSFRLDSHKLHFHIGRIHQWLQKGDVAPLYMEVSPSGSCNHRCVFCALDFMGYKPRFLQTEIFCKRLEEFARAGVKSIMYAGEGEPLLHRDIETIAKETTANNIDIAFTTNGVLLNEKKCESLLPLSSWIKVSCNGGTPETYGTLHGCKKNDFNKVIDNLRYAVELKNRHNYQCTLGLQAILLPENRDELTKLAGIAREIGLDYFVVKAYSQHPQSKTNRYADLSYEDCEQLSIELQQYQSDSFQVIFRHSSMQSWNKQEKGYEKCLALPFWSYLDAAGNIFGCSMFLGKNEFYYGNIYENSFQDIWSGEKRKASLKWVDEHLNVEKCRVNCRMNAINQYLWDLRNPAAHVNFI